MTKNQLIVTGFTLGWLIPFVLLLFATKVRRGEKLLWCVLSLFGSWFTYGFYLLVAPLHPPQENTPTPDNEETN